MKIRISKQVNKAQTKKEQGAKSESKSKSKAKLMRLLIYCGVFAVLLVVLALLKKSSAATEFMVTKVSRRIIAVMGRVTGAVPFSMYELFLYLAGIAIIGGLTLAIILLAKKRFYGAGRTVTSLLLAALVVANVYFLSAGFSYNRYQEYYPLHNQSLTKQQTVALADYFLDDLNQIAQQLERDEKGYAIMPYSIKELSNRLRQEYKRLDGYNINKYTPNCKTILSSGIMSEMSIYGVFFAPFGEANINRYMPVFEMPYTMAHEMAHSKGIMREDEANNVAMYITLTSDDPFIRYSGYSEGIYTLLDAVWAWEQATADFEFPEFTRLSAKVSPLLKTDWKSIWDYFEKYSKLEKLGEITDKINDLYLKIMGQKEGTGSYSPPPTDIVDKPATDPGGNIITDPGGLPIIVVEPEYNTVQQIFFRAFLERNGKDIIE